jgi:hypothetical protein
MHPKDTFAGSIGREEEDKMNKALIILGTVVGGALAGTLSYGTYGYLREKKKYSSWKAGAATGAIGGGLSVLALLVAGKLGTNSMGNLLINQPGLGRLPNIRLSDLPANIGYVAAEKLGCPTCR